MTGLQNNYQLGERCLSEKNLVTGRIVFKYCFFAFVAACPDEICLFPSLGWPLGFSPCCATAGKSGVWKIIKPWKLSATETSVYCYIRVHKSYIIRKKKTKVRVKSWENHKKKNKIKQKGKNSNKKIIF